MRRPYKIAAIVIALAAAAGFYRYRWGVLGVVGIGPPQSACERVEALETYLNTGGDPSAYLWRTPLIMCAAEAGSEEVVTELINIGTDVDAQKAPPPLPIIPAMDATTGMTALYVAVEKDHREIVKLLVDSEADINVSGPGNLTPLNAAIVFNRSYSLEVFLSADRSIYNLNSDAISTASSLGNLDVFQTLLKHDLDLEDAYERALQSAIASKNLEIVELLRANGVKQNQK